MSFVPRKSDERPDAAAVSEDAALGGRLRLRQPVRGHRFGHDAILLAAAVPAAPGERAIDLGAGVGAAGLALAVRVDGVDVTLAEIDPGLCALAADNALVNRMDERVRVLALDVTDPAALAAADLDGAFDHVLMNPPFNDAARHQLSPDPRRRLAHAATEETLSRWAASAAQLLRPHGVLTLIWRAERLDEALQAIAAYFGDIGVLPIYPRPEAAAIRILLRARKGAGGSSTAVPGLTLNDAQGQPTAAAEAILRSGAPLLFSSG